MNKPSRWILAAFAAAALAAVAAATTPPNLARALEEQQRLLADDPGDAGAINDYGNLLQLAGRFEEAEQAYRRALELAPERISPRFNLGLLLQRGGRWREALAEYQSVLAREPDHAWAHYQIGSLYEAQGDDRRAIRWYGRAFALEPRLAFAEYNPGVIENRLVDEAMLLGYRAEQARPLAPQVYEQPGRIRDLMLPARADETAAEGEPAEETADETRTPDDAGPGTLGTGDLDPRAGLNQASPQRAGRPSSVRYQPPPASRTREAPRARTWQRPDAGGDAGERPGVQGGAVFVPPEVQDPPDASGRQPTLQPAPSPAPRVVVPGRRPVFRPGVRSTGRLELELVPSATERAG